MNLSKLISKWVDIFDLEEADTIPIETAVASYASVYRRSTIPIWTIIVAPSSGLKTEVCRSVMGIPETVRRDDLTASALQSGIRKKNREDLLANLNGRVLLIKDFTVILSKRLVLANELLGRLRAIYDGFFDNQTAYGTNAWEGTFGLLAASTSAIDRFQMVQANLGERFLKVRFRGNYDEHRLASGLSASKNVGEDMQNEIRDDLRAATAEFMEPFRQGFKVPRMSNSQYGEVAKVAEFATRARVYVDRDYSGVPYDKPDIEMPGRLSQQLTVVAQTLAAMRNEDVGEHELDIVRRIAFDCIPLGRGDVLRYLAEQQDWMKIGDIMDATSTPKTTLSKYILTDLRASGLVESRNNPHDGQYRLRPSYVKLVSGVNL